ncbi:hypothetical protein Acr_03g0008190 [Actinidia rufa]|uniref:ARM repeat superfamily protein n=1 Tax=Actinidia rufa TaxID=165716 RepID=A0A7J0EC95_9ERIC|nr:hypothetical protein Acr_03g0008190 [Actinidia rufa]
MIKEGAVGKLFELMYCHGLSSMSLHEQVAATIMHLTISTTSPEADQMQVSIFESEEDVVKLFSLISLTGPDAQQSIIQTFIAMCQSSYGFEIRTTFKTVRASGLKLFCYLTEDGDDKTSLEHVGQRCIETLSSIVKTSNNAEEPPLLWVLSLTSLKILR